MPNTTAGLLKAGLRLFETPRGISLIGFNCNFWERLTIGFAVTVDAVFLKAVIVFVA